ncbi:MAG: 30S ribosomal protein S27ae [Thermoplasmata archaeon]
MMKRELYVVENDKLVRKRRFCPRCGPGVFLAEHDNRYTCGRCHYSETKKVPTKSNSGESPKPTPKSKA